MDAHSSYYARVKKRISWIHRQLYYFRLSYDFEDVLFTGHSMGGTEASMAPVMFTDTMHLKFYKKFGVKLKLHTITFAQTRPGGSKFAKLARARTNFHRRIENCADPATVLPLNALGYQHIDDAVLIYPKNSGFELVQYDISKRYGGLGIGFEYLCTIRSGLEAFFFQQTYVQTILKI